MCRIRQNEEQDEQEQQDERQESGQGKPENRAAASQLAHLAASPAARSRAPPARPTSRSTAGRPGHTSRRRTFQKLSGAAANRRWAGAAPYSALPPLTPAWCMRAHSSSFPALFLRSHPHLMFAPPPAALPPALPPSAWQSSASWGAGMLRADIRVERAEGPREEAAGADQAGQHLRSGF